MAKSSASLVERAAQAALKGKDDVAEQTFDMNDVPTPLYWQIIVEPIRPKKMSASGILHLAQETQDIEKFQINVGKVMAIGRLAFQGKTESGLDLSVESDRIKIGTFVQWYRHTGQEIKVQQANGEDRLFRSISCDDLMCIPADPYRIRFWA